MCTWPPRELQVDPKTYSYPLIDGPFCGITFSPQPKDVTRIVFLQGKFGLTVHGTGSVLRVSLVEEVGLGKAKGIQLGDHVVECNGQPIDQTMADSEFVRLLLSLGRPVVLGFTRDGSRFIDAKVKEPK